MGQTLPERPGENHAGDGTEARPSRKCGLLLTDEVTYLRQLF
jgi:hypothetical protein